jgi:MYXO-CTERM domain-containing protein
MAAVLATIVAMAGFPTPVRAGTVTFGTPSFSSSFGKGVEFTQPYSGGSGIDHVYVSVQVQGDFGRLVTKPDNVGSKSLDFLFDASKGQIQPNTHLDAHFEVVFSDGSVQDGPEISAVYVDDRFHWQTLTGKLVILHWYSGSQSFAEQALQLGESGVEKAAQFLGYTETKPIDFFIYAEQQPFYDALGPATRDNVGGQANPQIRTLFALIAPGDMSYAASVVPHELTHVVFDDLTGNPFHMPPHWLNEGIAVYVSQGYGSDDRSRVEDAVSRQQLMPLVAIRGEFPTGQTQFYLAYAEAVSAVDFFVKTYGHDKLVKLLDQFAAGASDDEAFTAAIGMGVDAFDAAWQASVGATSSASGPLPTYGPRPGPTGPLPPGWTASGLSGPGNGSQASPSTSPATSASRSDGTGSSTFIPPVAAAGLGAAGLAVLLGLRRRWRSGRVEADPAPVPREW